MPSVRNRGPGPPPTGVSWPQTALGKLDGLPPSPGRGCEAQRGQGRERPPFAFFLFLPRFCLFKSLLSQLRSAFSLVPRGNSGPGEKNLKANGDTLHQWGGFFLLKLR